MSPSGELGGGFRAENFFSYGRRPGPLSDPLAASGAGPGHGLPGMSPPGGRGVGCPRAEIFFFFGLRPGPLSDPLAAAGGGPGGRGPGRAPRPGGHSRGRKFFFSGRRPGPLPDPLAVAGGAPGSPEPGRAWEGPPSAGPLAPTCSLPGAAQPGGKRSSLGSIRRAAPGLRRDASHALLGSSCAVGEAGERGTPRPDLLPAWRGTAWGQEVESGLKSKGSPRATQGCQPRPAGIVLCRGRGRRARDPSP